MFPEAIKGQKRTEMISLLYAEKIGLVREAVKSLARWPLGFNPRPRTGGDRISCSNSAAAIGFNPRPPAGANPVVMLPQGEAGKTCDVEHLDKGQTTMPRGRKIAAALLLETVGRSRVSCRELK